MKKTMAIVFVILIASWGLAQEKGTFKYIGAEKCKMCHNTAKSGKQYDIWAASGHAKAYTTLATEKSKTIAKGLGIENPQTSEKCLTCHVTAFAVDAKLKDTTLTLIEGIGCEECHGPGSSYKKMTIMKDRTQALANGMLIPDEKTCLRCHNEKSPTYKPFKYLERLKEIAHPTPKESKS